MILLIESPSPTGFFDIKMLSCKDESDIIVNLKHFLCKKHNTVVRVFEDDKMTDEELKNYLIDQYKEVVGEG